MAFGLALAAQACARRRDGGGRSIVWVRQDEAVRESGNVNGEGLAMLGIDPDDLLVVHTRTFADTLRAGLEVLRCPAAGVALIETVAPVDLTASRRFKLAAERSGVLSLLIRHADVAVSNAVSIRWHVSAAPSREPETGAAWPSIRRAAFDVTLTKHPNGLAGKRFAVEWDHDNRQFCPPLPLSVAAVPDGGSLAA